MHWLILGSAIAASAWATAMTKMEASATDIKQSAVMLKQIADEQVKDGQLNRLSELIAANETLNEEIANAKLMLDKLERASQK